MRFYLDENVPPAIAAFLRRHHADVLTTEEAGNRQRDNGCLVTFNVGHFRLLGIEAILRQRSRERDPADRRGPPPGRAAVSRRLGGVVL